MWVEVEAARPGKDTTKEHDLRPVFAFAKWFWGDPSIATPETKSRNSPYEQECGETGCSERSVERYCCPSRWDSRSARMTAATSGQECLSRKDVRNGSPSKGQPSRVAAPVDEMEVMGSGQMMNVKPVLLVEAVADQTPAAWDVLLELGIAKRVVRTSNGDEALTYARENRTNMPVVILVDGFEPNQSGFDWLRSIKSDRKLRSIPIIVLGTRNDPEMIDECYRLGVAGYIVKSDNRDELVDAMRAVHEYWTLSEVPVCW